MSTNEPGHFYHLVHRIDGCHLLAFLAHVSDLERAALGLGRSCVHHILAHIEHHPVLDVQEIREALRGLFSY